MYTKFILNIYPNIGSNKWQKVPGIIKGTEATAKNLDEGTEYDFRVMAVNEQGESSPLVTSSTIKAKHPFGNVLMIIYITKWQSKTKKNI